MKSSKELYAPVLQLGEVRRLMSLVVDALRPSLVAGLMSLRGRSPTANLTDIIICAPKAGFDLDFDDDQESVEIDFRESSFVTSAIGGDASRFASAAFVTLISSVSIEKAIHFPWGLIKLYYAAFYAGHSILRLSGQSCSYLDPVHISRLRELAIAQNLQPKSFPDTGLYHCILNPAQTGFVLKKARGRVGGAHEAFWKIFGEFLETYSHDLLLSHLTPDDAKEVFLKLSALLKILNAHGSCSGSWLSQVRNEVQYRHGAVWPPPSVKDASRETLSRLAEQWLNDPMKIELEYPPAGRLGEFVAACAFLTSLCRVIFYWISNQCAQRGRSFANGPLSYCVTR